jgi:hypothetical protein
MWFSGAAHPALSEWDRRVFMALQPSYHMKQAPGGGWQLRGVLAVPVPGHSSPLLASAVIERTNMALAASAAMAVETPQSPVPDAPGGIDYDRLADAIVASMGRREAEAAQQAAELEAFAAMLETAGLGDNREAD